MGRVFRIAIVSKDDVLNIFALAARGTAGNLIGQSIRPELARSTDRAVAALRITGKYFDRQPA